jgi:hypothetical protein
VVLVPVADVLYLKAELKYVTLRTRMGEHLIEEPLVAIEREFAERFVRVHRNCLVARAAIRGFERTAGGSEEEPVLERRARGPGGAAAGEPAPVAGGEERSAGAKAMTSALRIATRRSRLALWQAEHVQGRLAVLHTGIAH